MTFYKNKKVLVTGGTGLIGRSVVDMLVEEGARVRIASLEDKSMAHPDSEFLEDLTSLENCKEACEGMDYVFHVAGTKGNPKMAIEKPVSFFESTILFNTNMMKAAWQSGVERYLYTSTVGVYAPAEILQEDSVWRTFPSDNDKFAGWAKRMGELQAQAYLIEHGWDKISIVRPGNIYGPHDNFNPISSTAVASIIKRAVDGENPLTVWGNGKAIRDFLYVDDCARGILLAMEKNPGALNPINLGTGKGYSIKDLVGRIVENLEEQPEIVWDTSKITGDSMRLLDITRAKEMLGWKPEISLEEGVRRTVNWYKENKDGLGEIYTVFEKKSSR